MVGPVAVNPFRKAVIIDAGDRYVIGTFAWGSRQVVFRDVVLPKNDTLPAVAVARLDPTVRGILIWSRFPFWEVRTTPDGKAVTVRDARFAGIERGGFSATTVVKQP